MLMKMATITTAAFLALAASIAPAAAAERTVVLHVENIDCDLCAPIIRRSLLRIGGVIRATVSIERNTATVTFDDARTDVAALTTATTNAGFPSRPAE
jgi:mercuric ion binding protein